MLCDPCPWSAAILLPLSSTSLLGILCGDISDAQPWTALLTDSEPTLLRDIPPCDAFSGDSLVLIPT